MILNKPKILIVYTGGTIGMIHDPDNGMLKPFDFDQITDEVPELKKLDCLLDAVSFKKPIDSSNMNPVLWKRLGDYIWKCYDNYSGFVILHGTDTMAYTASALSFMFRNLTKPIVFTGSQLPIGTIRTDGKENLITSIEIAAKRKNGYSVVQEVAIYFEYQLYRANRTIKVSSEDFEAFKSFNYPPLAEAGVQIKFNEQYLLRSPNKKIEYHSGFDPSIGILYLFPGIDVDYIQHFFKNNKLKAIVILTYGSGNAPTDKKFIDLIKKGAAKNKLIINLTQCNAGKVEQENYETGRQLLNAGVLGAADMTLESVLTKLMILLAEIDDLKTLKKVFLENIAGEITLLS